MLRPLIEFCASNVASGAEPAKEILEKDSDLDVLEYGCLDYCHECGLSLFAFVEGEPVKEIPRKVGGKYLSFYQNIPSINL